MNRAKMYQSVFDPRFQIGPLGFWKVGDEALLADGSIVVVGSLDLDGMAIAWRVEWLEQRAWENDSSLQAELDRLGGVRTGYNTANLTRRQVASCKAMAARGAAERAMAEAAAA